MHTIPHICRGYGDRKVKSNRCSAPTSSVYLSAPRKCFIPILNPGSFIHFSPSTLSFDSLAANLRHCSNVVSLPKRERNSCPHTENFYDTFLGNWLIHVYMKLVRVWKKLTMSSRKCIALMYLDGNLVWKKLTMSMDEGSLWVYGWSFGPCRYDGWGQSLDPSDVIRNRVRSMALDT